MTTLYIILAFSLCITVLVFVEHLMRYLSGHVYRVGFQPVLCLRKLFSRTTHGFTVEDRILMLVFSQTLMIAAIAWLPSPVFVDPMEVFYGAAAEVEQAALAFYEAEDFYSNIAEVIYESVFEAEEEGVGFVEGNIGKVVIDYDAAFERARWLRPSQYRTGGILGETTIGANYGPGEYTANFVLKLDNNSLSGVVLRLDAYDPHKNRIIKEHAVYYDDFDTKEVYQNIPFTFEVDQLQSVVLRVKYEPGAKAQLWYDNVSIVSNADEKVLYRRDQHFGIVPDQLASGGAARKAFSEDPVGHMLFGINSKQLNFGNYEASFRLKVADNTESIRVARIEVIDNQDPSDMYVYRDVHATDFVAANEYQEFVVPFVQKGRREIDFRVFTVPRVEVYVDSVSVVQR